MNCLIKKKEENELGFAPGDNIAETAGRYSRFLL
jgi:hypothetical protein